MNASSLTFKEVVIDLMNKNQASSDSINAYHMLDEDEWDNINKLFIMLAAFLEVKTKAS